jgi:hypothetical protein
VRRAGAWRPVSQVASQGASQVASQVASLVASLAVLAVARGVAADDVASTLMATPTGYTDVADAFEPGNPLDVNVQLGYLREVTSGNIQREVVDSASQDGRSAHHLVNVAEHSQVRNELALRLEVGIYHDLMLFVRVPLVLSDDTELKGASGACDGNNDSAGCTVLKEPATAASMQPTPLFNLAQPLVSARRSGLPSIDFGLAWAVTNQYRMPHLATWVLIIETSADTGAAMQPCLSGQSCEPGISRGTTRLKLESRWSYRYRYVEPYIGVSHTFEWVGGGESVFHPTGPLAGIVDDGPPSVSEGTLGAAVIPWEDRVRHQRFEIDVRGTAALTSAGRDFSPLFDALGNKAASANPYLTTPNDSASGKVPFSGLTNVEAHARLGLETRVVMQAARYVRFALGAGLAYLTPHLITGAPACAGETATVDSGTGLCDTGVANPVYRAAIDAPGQRFRLAGELAFRLQIAATAQF